MLAALARPLKAQYTVRSWLPWRTVETQRFVFNYPAELEDWTRAVASHADAVAGAASAIIGYAPPQKTQVVVDDPYELSNGMAWPFIGKPVINLWAVPPDPREDIGEFSTWGTTLLSHEYAHIAHLSRPSRNASWQRLWGLLPVALGPIPVNAPAWVIEGYATVIEGRVTQSGRPHGAWRPAFLREWALEGQLPRYEQLSNFGGFEGGEFRYLAGSAFLEWLAARGGDSSLVHLWRRMTARETRTFDAAFVGVFGESPRALYGKFAAEVTANVADTAKRMRAEFPGDTGAIVQRLSWATGDPAISRDGKRVAITLRSPVSSRIVVWSTAYEPDTGRAKRDSILLARDPEDVPARSIFPPPKRALATLRAHTGASFDEPRFLSDGRVLVQRFVPLVNGIPRTDLYIWNPARGSVRRVTHGAAVRLADPHPDARSAVAMHCARGWCDLARVDLLTGDVSVLFTGSPTRSYYRPRYSADGKHIAVSVHDGAHWQIQVIDAATRDVSVIADSRNAYDVAWVNDTTLVAVSDASGIPQIVEYDAHTGARRAVTHVTGAAVAPEPNPADHSIWFLSLYASGYDLRQIRGAGATLATLATLAATSAAATVTFATNAVSGPRPYRARPRATRYAPLPLADADGVSFGLALNNEDIVGQAQIQLRTLGSFGRGWRGGAIDLTSRRRLPFSRLELFDAGAQRFTTFGALFSSDAVHAAESWTGRLRTGVSLGRVKTDSTVRRTLFLTDASIGWSQRDGARTASESMTGSLTFGNTSDTRFARGVGTVAVSTSGFLPVPFAASATWAQVSAGAASFEQLSLGGSASPLFDRGLLTQRLAMPVLPASSATGLSAFTYNITLTSQPLSAYYWAGRLGGWQRVIGLESAQSGPVIRSAAIPAARVVFGVGESLDAPLRHRVRGYVNVFVTP